MKILFFTFIYLVLVFTNVCCKYIPVCKITKNNKKPGIEQKRYSHGARNDLEPSWNGFANNSKMCILKCKLNLHCQMAVFNHRIQKEDIPNCAIFNVTGIKKDNCCEAYTWTFCNFTYGSFVKNRCSGKWLLKEKSTLQSFNYRHFSMFKVVGSLHECMTLCLQYDICGGFNFYPGNKTCSIVESYIRNDTQFKNNINSNAYLWYCAYIQSHNVPKECSFQNGKCHGKFQKVNTTKLNNVLETFSTRSYIECLNNCLQFPTCYVFLFSEYFSYCILLSNMKMICTEHFSDKLDSRYSIFEWKCCMTENTQLVLRNNDKNRYTKCGCITHPKYLQMKQLNCNAYYAIEAFSANETCKHAKIHCSSYQCFFILKEWTSALGSFLIAYTGYDTFVLKNVTENIIIYDNQNILCQTYNATPIKGEPNIISRTAWFAMEYEGGKQMKLPLKYIVIGNLLTKLCFCRSLAACEDELRYQQRFKIASDHHDLTYNFIVAGDGYIFEGSGWMNKYITQSSLKHDFLFIAFMGNFSNGLPLIESLKAVKILINTAVEKGYVDGNYTLYIAPSINIGSISKAASLYRIIGLWKNYKNRKKITCDIFNVEVIGLNVAGILIMTIIVLILIKFKVLSRHSIYCQNILSNMSISCKFFLYRNRYIKSLSILPSESSLFSIFLTDKDFCINIYYTDIYWLYIKPEKVFKQNHSKNCFLSTREFLKFYALTKRVLKLSMLLELPCIKHCQQKSIIFICKSKVFLFRQIIVIAHLEETISPIFVRSLIVKFANKRCFCKGFNIKVLSEFRNLQEIFEIK